MKKFNPMQYLAIDIANHYGLDKLNYEERIQWVKTHLDELEQHTDTADEPLLYAKAVHAMRESQAGKPVGHAVAFDSVCSGLQLMSVLTNCVDGMRLTGLIDPDNRADAYTAITKAMNERIQAKGETQLVIDRKQAKKCVMTALYGSKATPKKILGDELYPLFIQTMFDEANGAMNLLDWSLNSWQQLDIQSWIMPDNHTVYLPTEIKSEYRVNIDEINYNPQIIMTEVQAIPDGISNCANLVHSVDALVLRELVRRCNYNKGQLKHYLHLHHSTPASSEIDDSLWVNQRYLASKFASMACLNAIDHTNIHLVNNELRNALASICEQVLTNPSFEIITIHDSFACHPVNMNTLRQHYNEILVQMYESDLLVDLLSQIYHKPITLSLGDKIHAELIRHSNYGIC
ncbi:DNA-directed RNA polymerase [Moraxella sp. ZJ142]|uniref:DNA-directed RNA polymerase n=1 Tax=Moraxella marmotae TaxID=3344520 RepID=UPI0035D49E6C